MPTIVQLPSGKWRAQIRKAGIYKAATFPSRADAKTWADAIEGQTSALVASGVIPVPRHATLADLIDRYCEDTPEGGRTKTATLAMLRRELGHVKLAALGAVHLRDFVDKRLKQAGGVTVAADLSFLSSVLKWGRHARHLDVKPQIALDARAALAHRKVRTRGRERSREPTDAELKKLYAHWSANPRQTIPMELLCRFALASAMRQGEICRLNIEDIDRDARTVVIRNRKDPREKEGNDQVVPLLPAAWKIVEPRIRDRTEGRLFDYEAASVSAAFTRACAALDIKDLHFHDLRHRAARELFGMGLDIPQVALLTGHKTWAMLRRYTDIRPADVFRALARKGDHS